MKIGFGLGDRDSVDITAGVCQPLCRRGRAISGGLTFRELSGGPRIINGKYQKIANTRDERLGLVAAEYSHAPAAAVGDLFQFSDDEPGAEQNFTADSLISARKCARRTYHHQKAFLFQQQKRWAGRLRVADPLAGRGLCQAAASSLNRRRVSRDARNSAR